MTVQNEVRAKLDRFLMETKWKLEDGRDWLPVWLKL